MEDARPPPRLALVTPPAGPAPLEGRTDDELMALAATGHRPAFQALAGRHLPSLTSFCVKLLGQGPAGEEVTQDVLLELWTHRAAYRPEGRFKVFLLGMARSRCLNRLRADGRRGRWLRPAGPEPEAGRAGPDAPDQLDALLARERGRRVRAALATLPPKLREALLLRFDQGLPYGDIAALTGRNEATVRSRVFHGLKRLRQLVGEEAP
jgi:RNA polymerase sigma-70 factor (ECF subfamily)